MLHYRAPGFLCAAVVFCTACLASRADDAVLPEIAKLRDVYEKELAKIVSAQSAALLALKNSHINAMSTLAEKLQRNGQLEPLLAVQSEKERFLREGVVLDEHRTHGVAELAKLQEAYCGNLAGLPLSHSEKIVNLVQQYDRSLANLQKTYTQDGKIDNALKVKTEREAVEARQEVMAARFTIEEAKAKMPPKTEVVTPPTESKPATRPPTPAPSKKYTGSDENRVRKRYLELFDVLSEQNYDAAAKYIDPAYVLNRGLQQVTVQLRWIFPYANYVRNDPRVKHDVDSVKLSEDGKSATLVPRLWVGNAWREQRSVSLVLADGDWYVSIESYPSPQQLPPADMGPRPGHRR